MSIPELVPDEVAPTRLPRAPRPMSATTSTYTELAATIRASGLMERRYGYYWSRIVACVLAFGLLTAAVVQLGDSWWQLVLAAGMGLLVTQFGFLGHDAAHRQIFATAAWNDWTARLLSGVFAGLSYGWWRGKHNRHHANPNQEGADPDIAPGALAFTRDIAAERTTGAAGWFQQRQGWLFFPLLTLEGLNLHAAGVRLLLGRDPVPHRWVELGLVTTRLGAYVAGLAVLLPPGKAVAFFFVQMAVFGLCLGGSFAPSHKGMPIVPRTMKIDFLQRQVLMSRNVRGSVVVDAMMGGLNYQIEHHLFPSMPRPNLKRARPLVREHCSRHEVPYAELGLVASWAVVIDYLNNVGLRARGPFDCPLASTLRD
ncbi:acyl-CoA desaturase [Nocardioides sp.]|uniref:fatty acid desaturase family protein n=1 Tax=Nocardioides sp. TaxID=35761 RepID=UPI0027177CEE|nr:acyl-CoA desaturase [Nocardioides sp.]MDO9458368.1 acyl-CoA desaturase [Nocardioides sp.]